MARRHTKPRPAQVAAGAQQLYTLAVSIISGPMTHSFIKKNRVVSRTIQIRDDQTLESLHRAIFKAFGRWEEHMYEFQIGGKGPMDPKARQYVLPVSMDAADDDNKPVGDVKSSTIGSLGLRKGEAFGYWFDFGDDWWHQIDVVSIDATRGRGKYPKVVKRIGKSPPQYVDWDEEGDEDEGDEEGQ